MAPLRRELIFVAALFLFGLSLATSQPVHFPLLGQEGSLTGSGVYSQCTEPAEEAQFNAGQACVGCVLASAECPPQCCAADLADGQALLCLVGGCCNRVVLTSDGGLIYGMEALAAETRGDGGICGGVGPVPTLGEDPQAGCGQCAAAFSDKDNSSSLVDCRGAGYAMPAYTEPARNNPTKCADGSGGTDGAVEIGASSFGTDAPPSSGDGVVLPGESGGSVIESGEEKDQDGSAATGSMSTAEPQVTYESDDREAMNDPACFPGEALVEYLNGTTGKMRDTAVGDVVKVEKGKFSPVFMFTHRFSGGRRVFMRLMTDSHAVLELTDGHYLYVNNVLMAAKSVVVGDILTLGNGEATAVRKLSRVFRAGLYNPQTISGNIVVDGVITSTYTTAVSPAVAHVLLGPLRLLSRAGFCLTALEGGVPSEFNRHASRSLLYS